MNKVEGQSPVEKQPPIEAVQGEKRQSNRELTHPRPKDFRR